MKIIEQILRVADEELILTNRRALYWPREKALVLSDLHLGKPAHFRKNGIGIPTSVATKDLARLEVLLDSYKAEQLIIVGDLIHSRNNKEVQALTGLLAKYPKLHVVLIKGNHDRMSLDELQTIGIYDVYQDIAIEPFMFSHQNMGYSKNMVISGHVHPGVAFPLPTRKWMRFPCYVVTEREIILPAFSAFTGLDTHSLPANAICYAFYEEGIFKVV